ncbi:MAG: isochorismatase family protein [Acidobacteriota bacterium]|nr:isochorismatase family protein [Acidobacteriota bacterium]
MHLLEKDRSVVVAVDLQGRMLSLVERSDEIIAATSGLLQLSDVFGVPVVVTEQYPRGLGPTADSVLATYEALKVPKQRVAKTSFGCCGDAGFQAAIDAVLPEVASGDRQYVIAGIEAHICVVQTVIELLHGADEVFVCWDCVSSRGAAYRRWGLRRMEQAGAIITNLESVGFEWARDKEHPSFREMSRLFRDGQAGVDDPV